MTNANVQNAVDFLSTEGRYIEAGWTILREAATATGTSAAQLQNMRTAFYAGASHLFDCLDACIEIDDHETRRVVFDQLIQSVSQELNNHYSDLNTIAGMAVEGHA